MIATLKKNICLLFQDELFETDFRVQSLISFLLASKNTPQLSSLNVSTRVVQIQIQCD